MNNTNVFISVGTNLDSSREAFVSALEQRLEAEGLIPNTVGRNKFSAEAPLKTITGLMAECSGAIILALERVYFPQGIERRNTSRQRALNETRYTTDGTISKRRLLILSHSPFLSLRNQVSSAKACSKKATTGM